MGEWGTDELGKLFFDNDVVFDFSQQSSSDRRRRRLDTHKRNKRPPSYRPSFATSPPFLALL